ncbi:MAG: HAMP domain-containing protein [Polyangiaceae bacterium]|nr:HAMP domain-containing protein [Polyangiaceae bacterium]
MKLGTKLALTISSLVVAVLSVLGTWDVFRDQAVFEADTTRDQLVLANVLAATAERVLGDGGDEREVDALLAQASRREAQLELTWGPVDAPLMAPLDELPASVWEDIRSGRPSTIRIGSPSSKQWTVVPGDAGKDERFFIAVGESLEPESSHLDASAARSAAAIAILALLSSAAIRWVSVRVVGRPVRQLVAHARAVATGDLEHRLDLRQRDEIGRLGDEMNAMTAALATSRRQLEAETERRLATVEQLRHADRLTTVGKLASGLAHELGTPLNVVHGYGRLVQSSDANEKVRSYGETIVAQTERMTKLVRQLLDFARRRGPKRESTDLSALARRVAGVLEPTAKKKGISVVAKTGDAIVAAADPTMIEQVLTNLIFNALQASREGAGPITVVVTERAAAGPSTTAGWVCVEVSDHGSGIATEDLPRIFEPFFTTKQVGEGTGLGLSVTYGIVEDHGGTIEVDSKVGRGTTFRVLLPIDRRGA